VWAAGGSELHVMIGAGGLVFFLSHYFALVNGWMVCFGHSGMVQFTHSTHTQTTAASLVIQTKCSIYLKISDQAGSQSGKNRWRFNLSGPGYFVGNI